MSKRRPTESSAIRVLVVDNHEVVRSGLRSMMGRHPDLAVVGEAGSVGEAVRRVGYDDPDVVVLDVRLPDGSGIDACREIKARFPDVQVLMLTSFADEKAFMGALMCGASGFLLKKVSGTELVDGIRRVAAGESLFDAAETRELVDTIVQGPRRDPSLDVLSERELQVLQLVARGMTNKEIADETYLAEKTVKNYVSNMLTKMGFRRRSEAAAFMARRERTGATADEDWPTALTFGDR